ncbi:hypothetical protein EW145_g4476 [Phellinidium pouzarii]|uniref:DUF6534 domain-containing protein n=1 Tax=Phellinidium pouzarii TaxID=167371 RepID=A0A4S4L3C4_9AGAM|nr:hypothetical protein EW145_g4476 [Phellinidium pouzarii]
MATPPSTLHLDLSGTFGVIFWAFVVSTVYVSEICGDFEHLSCDIADVSDYLLSSLEIDSLFGVSVVQGYFYFTHNNDSRNLKIFVACMLTLDFSTTALSSQSLYDYLIVNYGNPEALLYMTKPYIVEYFITAVVTLGSQLFYASRIHIADKRSASYGIPIIIAVLALAAFGTAIGATHEIFHIQRLISGLQEKAMLIIAGINTALAATCDIVATLSMCIFLASQKSEYKQTRRIVSFLLFITINRGVLVAIAQLGFLTAYLGAPSKIYWMPFHLSVSKLHVNTLLAMLNSRLSLRAKTVLTQVRFSKECTFNTAIGQNLPISPSGTKGSLRLSGMAYELGTLSKAEGSLSPTTPESPSSKFTRDDQSIASYGDEHELPSFINNGGSEAV